MKFTRLSALLAALCAGVIAASAAENPASPAAKTDGPPYGYHVSVKLEMNEEGRPHAIQIVKTDDTTSTQILNRVALTIAAHSSLPPRQKDGHPVKFTAVQPFFFPIDDDEGPDSNKVPMPRLRDAVMPVWPQTLVDAQQVGGVIFDVQMDEAGRITQLKTLRASHPEVEQAGRESLEKWTFRAAEVDGKPVPSHFRLAIAFEGFGKIVEPKWSVAPRPALGTFFAIKAPADAFPAAADPAQPTPAEPAPADAAPTAK
jgi:hypothetical protein